MSTSPGEFYERMLTVLERTTVARAEWDPDCIIVERASAYPNDTDYPTALAMYPVKPLQVSPSHGGAPREADEWWAPDADFVNEDPSDPRQGFRFSEALVIAAEVTVTHASMARLRGDSTWWDDLAQPKRVAS